ncbi:hypothetical protein [Actinophytocola sp.]|uniref:hypothetical protein n=1 Tax=Actinophytocola sp. TaxID=1872138 RepID=UPI003899C1D9
MITSTTTATADRTGAPPAWPRWVFRGTSVLAAVMLFDQAVFAGRFLAGGYDALRTHRENATYAGIAVLVSTVAAVLVRVPGRGPWWPTVANAGIFGLVALQIVLGFARAIAVHVPLGTATILLAVLVATKAWTRL